MLNVETKHENDQLDQQLRTLKEGTNDQRKKVQEQMRTLTKKVEQSNKVMSNVQHEVTDLNNNTHIIEAIVRKNETVKSVEISEKKTTLGIYIRGISEKDTDMAKDRLHTDLKEIRTLLEFL